MKRTVRRAAILLAMLVLLLSHAVGAQAVTGDPAVIVSDYYALVDALDSASSGTVIGISGTITVPSPEELVYGGGDNGSRVTLRRMSSTSQIVFTSGGTGGSMVEKIRFDGNSAQAGGSIPFIKVEGKVNFDKCEFRKCKGYRGSGGALSVWVGGEAYLNNCSFTGNAAGSGAHIYNIGTVELNYCTLSGGEAENQGGGIYNGGTLTLNNSELSDCEAKLGGGIYNEGSLEINNSLIWNSFAGVQENDIVNRGTLTDNTTDEEYSSWLEGYGLYYIGWEADNSGQSLKLVYSYDEPTPEPDPEPNPEPTPDPDPSDPEEGGEEQEPSEPDPTDPPVEPSPDPEEPDEGDAGEDPSDPTPPDTGDEGDNTEEPTTPPEGGEVDPEPSDPPSEGDEQEPTNPEPSDPDIGGDNEEQEPPESGGEPEEQEPVEPTPDPTPDPTPTPTPDPEPTDPPISEGEQGGAEEPEDSPSDAPTPSPSPSHSHTPSPSPSPTPVSEPDPAPTPEAELKEEPEVSSTDTETLPIKEDAPVEATVAPQESYEPVIIRETVQVKETPQQASEPVERQEADTEVQLDPTQNIRIEAEGLDLIYEYTEDGVIIRVKQSPESPPEAANEAEEIIYPTSLSETPTEAPRGSVNWVETTTMILLGVLVLDELWDKLRLRKKRNK